MAKKVKPQRKKEPTVFGKIIAALYEDARRKKAIRILEKQTWGLDFLSMALARAGRYLGEGIVLVVTNKDGARIELSYDAAKRHDAVKELDSSIFMHLDDDLAVDRFIRENSSR